MKCMIPCSPYRTDKLETWLNEQAAKGRYLTRLGTLWATFDKTERFGDIYRIDLDGGKKEPDSARRAENEAAGWSYVCTIPGQYRHVYRAQSPDTRMEDSLAVREAAARGLRRSVLINSLMIVFCIAVSIGILVHSRIEWLLLEFMQSGLSENLIFLSLLIMLTFFIAEDIFSALCLAERVCKSPQTLHSGERERHPAVYRGLAILMVVCYLMIITQGFWSRREHYENLDGPHKPELFLDLRALEGEGFEVYEGSWHRKPSVNSTNRIERKIVPFADAYYEIYQSGSYEQSGQEYEKVGKTSCLEGEYWTIRPGMIATSLFDQLVVRNTEYGWYYSLLKGYEKLEPGTWTVEWHTDPRFLRLATAYAKPGDYRENMKYVIAQTEKQVLFLEYMGELETEQIIESLAGALGL